MHKKAIALLSAALVLAGMLTACEKHSRYGKIIVDSHGMEHVIMTDKNGVTVCDAEGNLVEIMTGSNKKPLPTVTVAEGESVKQTAEYQTNSVTFPDLVVTDDQIEDVHCALLIPEGWTQTKATHIILSHEATGAQISVTYDDEKTASEYLDKVRADCEGLGVTSKEGTAPIDDFTAKTLDYTVDGLQFRVYVVTFATGELMTILCTNEETRAAQVDFDAVLQTIRIK